VIPFGYLGANASRDALEPLLEHAGRLRPHRKGSR